MCVKKDTSDEASEQPSNDAYKSSPEVDEHRKETPRTPKERNDVTETPRILKNIFQRYNGHGDGRPG